MLFSSLTFIFLFLPVVLAVYYLAPLKIRNLLLLLAVVGMSAFGGRLLRRIISLPESEAARTVVAGILFFGMMAISVAFLVTETYQPFLYFRF